jgi:hypothetical protein
VRSRRAPRGWTANSARRGCGVRKAVQSRELAGGVCFFSGQPGGDSESTGSISGNLLALVHRKRGIPTEWLKVLEPRDVAERVERGLWAHFGPAEAGTGR